MLEVGPGIGPSPVSSPCGRSGWSRWNWTAPCFPILAETLADRPNAEICPGDILKTDIPTLVREKFQGLTPWPAPTCPITSPHPPSPPLLEAKCFSAITVMIQREVAHRICAAPARRTTGLSPYSASTTPTRSCSSTSRLTASSPAPKVTSSVLRMVPKSPPAEVDDETHFFRVVRAAFAQRRKTLANSLSASLGGSYGKQAVARAIEACGLPAAVRGAAVHLRLRRPVQGPPPGGAASAAE